ncbi:MAG: hypothetical protein WBA92_11300, partial [Pseudorhodobacter sp.]
AFEAVEPKAVEAQRNCPDDSVWIAMVCVVTECVNPLTPASWGSLRLIHTILARSDRCRPNALGLRKPGSRGFSGAILAVVCFGQGAGVGLGIVRSMGEVNLISGRRRVPDALQIFHSLKIT